jgi:membrane protease YdiL (CAAX protease family)
MTSSWKDSRAVSAVEVALGVCIILGHNVWRVLPNEVPILFGLGWVSFRLRNGSWAWGLKRPASWGRTALIALGAATLRVVLGELVVVPLAERIWPPIHESSSFDDLAHNPAKALLTLGLVWSFAAFGEELSYRGYLLPRAAAAANGSKGAYGVALLLSSVLFGFGHYYKGPAGVVDSTLAGLILGGAYLLSKRNLWVAIFAHGLVDTFAVAVTFLGWAN